MQEIIKAALLETMEQVLRTTPATKKQTKQLSILDVKPTELLEFMAKNNVPDDADFPGKITDTMDGTTLYLTGK